MQQSFVLISITYYKHELQRINIDDFINKRRLRMFSQSSTGPTVPTILLPVFARELFSTYLSMKR